MLSVFFYKPLAKIRIFSIDFFQNTVDFIDICFSFLRYVWYWYTYHYIVSYLILLWITHESSRQVNQVSYFLSFLFNMRNVDVELFDTKTGGNYLCHSFINWKSNSGEVESFNVKVDPKDHVGNLREKLGPTFVNASIFFHNQLNKLEDDDVIQDCMEEGDLVTGIIKYPHNDRAFKKDLENDSGSILVVLDNKSKRPIFLESGYVEYLNINSLTLYPTILVFRL